MLKTIEATITHADMNDSCSAYFVFEANQELSYARLAASFDFTKESNRKQYMQIMHLTGAKFLRQFERERFDIDRKVSNVRIIAYENNDDVLEPLAIGSAVSNFFIIIRGDGNGDIMTEEEALDVIQHTLLVNGKLKKN